MRPEHLERLWSACTDLYCHWILGPEFHSSFREVWEDWLEKGIIGEPIIADELLLPKNWRMKSLSNPHHQWEGVYEILDFENDLTENLSVTKTSVKLFPVNRHALVTCIAHEWNIEPDYQYIGPDIVQIGLKDSCVPVLLITDFKSLPVIEANELKENLDTSMLFIFKIGKSTIQPREVERMMNLSIISMGTNEFLTDHGKPRWIEAISGHLNFVLNGTPWSYDRRRDEIKFEGVVEKITRRKERRLFFALMHKKGKVVKREVLVKTLWPKTKDLPNEPDHSLTGHVSNLKHNLTPHASEWIQHFPDAYGFFEPRTPDPAI